MGIYSDNYDWYVTFGLVPYPAKGKEPEVKWSGPSPDREKLDKWAKKYPDSNIWIKLGPSIVVIDPDDDASEEFVRGLDLPDCPTAISGGKSKHRYFRTERALRPLKINNGMRLEVRTGNEGMLAPPSKHPVTGKDYRWEEGKAPWELGGSFPLLPLEVYGKIAALAGKQDRKPETQKPKDAPAGSLDVKRYLEHFGINYGIKQVDDAIFYTLERCLFAEDHTTKNLKGESAIVQGADGGLRYHCFHAHCRDTRTWVDARKVISGDKTLTDFWIKKAVPEKPSYKKAILSVNDLRGMNFPPKEMILSPWLMEQSLILVSGARGVGKTWFAYSVADTIARGDKLWKWDAAIPKKVLYVDGEMAVQDCQERFMLLGPEYTPYVQESPQILGDSYANMLGLPKINLNLDWVREGLKRDALDLGAKLIILDNLSSLCPGIDENSKQEWDPINQWLLDLRFSGFSVMMLHHTNKQGGQRGTSGREDNVDISITLLPPNDYDVSDGARFVVKFTKNRIGDEGRKLISDVEFKLVDMGDYKGWECCSASERTDIAVLQGIDEGSSQQSIADSLKVDKSTVSRTKKKLERDGYISNGKVTQAGHLLLHGYQKNSF